MRPTPSLSERIATPEGKRRYVRTMFATIADRYDLITIVLSYGRDRRWKERLIRLANPGSEASALDLATGTGDIAFGLAGHVKRVVALDITKRMIDLAVQKGRSRHASSPAFLVGDMVALPFPSATFDIVTTGYGLRNVPDLRASVDEILRVLKPGGEALSLDFNRPRNPVIRAAYLAYLNVVGGVLGWLLHRDPDTYRYIAASIRRYPGAEGVAQLMRDRGFAEVKHYPALGGLMSIHKATKGQ